MVRCMLGWMNRLNYGWRDSLINNRMDKSWLEVKKPLWIFYFILPLDHHTVLCEVKDKTSLIIFIFILFF